MGGGAAWYRITRSELFGGRGEQGLYKLESCFIPAGGELPETPPYDEKLASATFAGLQNAIPEYVFREIRENILALTKENPIFEYKPYPRHFAP